MSSFSMLVVEQPQPILRKKSVFRRLTRRDRPETHATDFTTVCSPSSTKSQSTPPRKLQRRVSAAASASASLPTPPLSPAQHQHSTRPTVGHAQQIAHRDHVPTPSKLPQAYHDSPRASASPDLSLRIQPNAMPSLPFSSTPSISPWDLFLPPAHVHALYLGYLPRSPSDPWFIYSEGPDLSGKLKVHFHRSGTGMKMAEVFVVMDVRGEGAGKIVGIKWNGGWETNRMSEGEAKFAVRGAVRDLGVELEHEP